MASPASTQIYLASTNNNVTNQTRRNEIVLTLTEPIYIPEGYEAHVMLVDAQIPVTWAVLQKFLIVRSNFQYRNQYLQGRALAKIPVNVAQNFYLNYVNQTQYSHPIGDRIVSFIDLSLHNEDGSDVSLGATFDWSCTLQIDFKKTSKGGES